MTRAVVIGGGPVGLSTAALLARGGLDVLLVERHSFLGGRSRSLLDRGHIVDASPWFFAPGTCEDFFALMGRRFEDYVTLMDPEIRLRVFYEEGLDTPSTILDLDMDTQTNWDRIEDAYPDDGAAARRLVIDAAGRHQLCRERLAHTAYRGFSSFLRSPTLRHLPWCVRLLATSTRRESAKAFRHSHLRQLYEFPSLFLTGSPSTTPVAYSSAFSHLLGGAIRHPRGGLSSIVAALEAIAREEGVTIRLDSDVARILVDSHTHLTTGLVLRTGEVLSADLVVSCVDPHHTETALLTEDFRSYPDSSWTRFKTSPSLLVASFGIRKRLPELAQHNVFFPRDWDRTVAALGSVDTADPFRSDFVYVGRPTATDSTMAPKGKDSLVLIAPLPADSSLGATEASRLRLGDLANRLLRQVGRMAAVPDLEERSRVGEILTPADLSERYSARQGSTLGSAPTFKGLTWARPGSSSRRIGNLFYPGASLLPGPGIAGALASAELTAKTLLGRNDADPLPSAIETGFLRDTTRTDVIGDLLRVVASGRGSDAA